MRNPDVLKNESGFTLIEIIAVLILLGILAAVAVPKYIDLQEDAAERSATQIRLELTARANQYFAAYLLDNTSTAGAGYDNTVGEWVTDLGTIGGCTISSGTGTTYNYISVVYTSYSSVTFYIPLTTQGSDSGPAEFGAVTTTAP